MLHLKSVLLIINVLITGGVPCLDFNLVWPPVPYLGCSTNLKNSAPVTSLSPPTHRYQHYKLQVITDQAPATLDTIAALK